MFTRSSVAVFLGLTLSAGAAQADIQSQAHQFVAERLGDMISSEAVVSAVLAQNAQTADLSEDAIIALDNDWRGGDDALISAALSNPLSDQLRAIVEEGQGVYSEIFVMDARGLNVGQSAKTSDYWQGDEAKYQQTYLVGADAFHVSDVEEDESTQTFQVQVSMPIVDGGTPIGAITVGVDVEYLE